MSFPFLASSQHNFLQNKPYQLNGQSHISSIQFFGLKNNKIYENYLNVADVAKKTNDFYVVWKKVLSQFWE